MKSRSFFAEAIEKLENNLGFLKTNMNELIKDLDDELKFEGVIDQMYARFHTLKALTNYLDIRPVYQSMQRIEEVFFALKEK